MAPGATLEVRLAGNPTTGYEWTVTGIDADHLQALGSTYEPDSSAIGSGGTCIFRFEALQSGTTTLALASTWPSSSKPAAGASPRPNSSSPPAPRTC